jgi:hypothetical protein
LWLNIAVFWRDDTILNIVSVAAVDIDLAPVLNIIILFKLIWMDTKVVDLVAIILVGMYLTIVSAFIRLTVKADLI